jgi:hypothetical protein
MSNFATKIFSYRSYTPIPFLIVMPIFQKATEEEKYFEKTFGEGYDDYRNNVPGLIPRLTPYRNPGIKQPEYKIGKGLKSETRTLQAFASVTIILIVLFLLGTN